MTVINVIPKIAEERTYHILVDKLDGEWTEFPKHLKVVKDLEPEEVYNEIQLLQEEFPDAKVDYL